MKLMFEDEPQKECDTKAQLSVESLLLRLNKCTVKTRPACEIGFPDFPDVRKWGIVYWLRIVRTNDSQFTLPSLTQREISTLFTEATEYSRANLHPFHQLIHFFICHLLPQLCKHIPQLSRTNEAIPLLIEYLKSTNEFLCVQQRKIVDHQLSNVHNTQKDTIPGVPAGLKPSGRLRIVKNVLQSTVQAIHYLNTQLEGVSRTISRSTRNNLRHLRLCRILPQSTQQIS